MQLYKDMNPNLKTNKDPTSISNKIYENNFKSKLNNNYYH